MVKITFILSIALILNSCVTVTPLSFERIENNSNLLNLSGYYYRKKEFSSHTDYNAAFFLYKNGVIRSLDAHTDKSLAKIDKYISEVYIKRSIKEPEKGASGFGVYKIKNQQFTFEYWTGAMDWHNYTIRKVGKIMSDSVFVITEIKFNKEKRSDFVNETYHFRQFSPKPDSTNKFIK